MDAYRPGRRERRQLSAHRAARSYFRRRGLRRIRALPRLASSSCGTIDYSLHLLSSVAALVRRDAKRSARGCSEIRSCSPRRLVCSTRSCSWRLEPRCWRSTISCCRHASASFAGRRKRRLGDSCSPTSAIVPRWPETQSPMSDRLRWCALRGLGRWHHALSRALCDVGGFRPRRRGACVEVAVRLAKHFRSAVHWRVEYLFDRQVVADQLLSWCSCPRSASFHGCWRPLRYRGDGIASGRA